MSNLSFDVFAGFGPFSYEKFKAATVALVAFLNKNGVTVPPGCRLLEYLRQLEAVCDIGDGQAQRAESVEIAVWHQAMLELDDYRLIATGLTKPTPLPGWQRRFEEVLSGVTLPQNERKHSSARDKQFELVIAALLRRAGFEVALEEPDVVITSTQPRFGIAAKRPRSRKNLRSNLRAANHQIICSPHDGVVAIDMSILLNPPNSFIVTDDFHKADIDVASIVDNFVRTNAARIRASVDHTRTFGIGIYAGVLVYDQIRPGLGYVRRWSFANLCEASDPRALTLARVGERINVASYLQAG